MKKRLWLILALVVLGVLGVLIWRAVGPSRPALRPPPPVEAAREAPTPTAIQPAEELAAAQRPPTEERIEPTPPDVAGEAGLEGSVLDPDGRPLEGAEVFLCEVSSPPPMGLAEMLLRPIPGAGEKLFATVSEPDGSFRFTGIPESRYMLTARADGFAQNGREVSWLGGEETQGGFDLILYPGEMIHGRVETEAGEAVHRARVKPHRLERQVLVGGPRWWDFDAGRSDASGAFALKHLFPGDYRLEVTAKGYAPAETSNVPTGDADVRIILQRGVGVKGKVADENGHGIPTARLHVQWSVQGGMPGRSQTRFLTGAPASADARGNFVLSGIPYPRGGQTTQVIAVASGYETGRWALPLDWTAEKGEAERITIVLAEGAMLRGRIQNEQGEGLHRAAIEVIRARDRQGQIRPLPAGPWRSSQSSSRGLFTLLGLPKGSVDLKFSAEGYESKLLEDVPTTSKPLAVTLGSGGAILGRVVREDRPSVGIAGVRVVAWRVSSGEAAALSGSAETTTDGEGRFALEGLSPGSYELRATEAIVPSSRKVTVEVGPGQVIPSVQIPLRSRQGIRGRVVASDGGEPIAGAKVVAQSGPARRTAQSDANGYFFLEMLSPGSWQLGARAEGFVSIPCDSDSALMIDLEPHETREGVTLFLTKGAAIAGLVQDAKGRPLLGALVSTTPGSSGSEGAFPSASALTDANGAFTLEQVAGGRETVLRVDKNGFAGYRSEAFELQEGQRRIWEPIRLERGWRLRGRVVDSQSEPLKARIELGPGRVTWSGGQGTFRLEGVPAGLHTVQVTAEGYQSREMPVAIHADQENPPVEIVLDALPLD